MTDKFERLKEALQRDPPPPDPGARQAALANAMARFQEKNATVPQGSAAEARPISSDGTGPSSIWSGIMDALKPSRSSWTPVLAGGASLAVLMIAVVSTGVIRPELFEKREAASPSMGKPVLADADKAANKAAQPGERADTWIGGGNKVTSRLSNNSAPMANEEPAGRPAAQSLPAPMPRTAPGFFGGSNDLAPRAPARDFAPQAQAGRAVRSLASPVVSTAKEAPAHIYRDQGRDRFEAFDPNPIKVVAEDPVSTFSVDVDTASYAFMRARLNQGVLPPADSVRVEEFINYFPYDYAVPDSLDTPFKANVSIMPTPWNAKTKLMRIGIKGYVPPAAQAPRANLVFLIDTSGSMRAPDKLPLLRNAFRLLLTSLHPDDTVAIVTYAGSAGTALEPTKVSDSPKIIAALDSLSAGGSTAGGEGIRQAYALAEANKVDGVNRVILATDGDFNVGISDTETLKDFVAAKRETGISLSVLGFGQGNYNDALMQALAQNGNGNASYIDTLTEARKVLVDGVAATLQTIAKDVKIQVEFNPARVAEYRLIGYETRMLNREDFNNDKVDAGEIGAGHTVTALYEITPAGSEGRLVDDLRYQSADRLVPDPSGEIAFIKIRYKQPDGDKSTLITTPVTRADEVASIAAADTDARFAAAVAGFGQLLKGGRYTDNWSIQDATALAEGARGEDRFGYRNEFVNLTRLAKTAAAMARLRK